ncbi:MAG: hypothetical protein GQ529_13580 [Methyloprofundus sp.]|nr:hypothetical protein [Methyloprofundus sp.]
MKRINVAAIVTSLLLVGGNVFAESTPLTNENIQGAWALEYTQKSEKGGETFNREDTWVFKSNGTVTIKHIPRDGDYYDQLPVSYEIDDNKLKIAILGRTGKFDSFSLINKDEKNMTLKARFGAIYQFVKR